MKRFHVHVAVKDLPDSVRFYSAMFGLAPTVIKPDYAKWMLEDPRVNFAISNRNSAVGVNHLGMQAETETELEDIHAKLALADHAIVAEKGVHCCYANSDKYWVTDPQGIAWESFRSLGDVPRYGGDDHAPASASCGSEQAGGCCTPANEAAVEKKSGGCCEASA
jgi:catechol 2,3-dioxygenase-like lactoylglutathione lyase family enzyme